jgi:hypothetical protein
MQGPNPFERVKKPLIVVCVGYGLLMFALFISMVAGNPSVETKQQIALAGIYSLLWVAVHACSDPLLWLISASSIMSVVSILTAIGFLVSAVLLARVLSTSGKNNALTTRFYRVGALVAACYIVQSALWIW